jgi:uncharacterized membrane protein (UPF0127 family)
MARFWFRFFATLALFSLSVSSAVRAAPPTIGLKAGGHRIVVEVAATLESRDVGLMNRKHLPPDRGMLFVFPEAHRHCMWMHNTSLPLSIAFIDDGGAIVNIAEMLPNSETYHCAARPVRYALEMNRGWFRQRGLGPGAHIDGLSRAPTGT